MKILMIAPQPFFQARGTPFSVLHRLKALSHLGYTIDLITYHLGENIPIKSVKIFRIIKIPFVTRIDIGPSFTKILCDVFIFFKAFHFLIRNKYDVIHTHEEAGFMGIIFKLVFNIPHVYDMHSSLPQQLSNFKRGNVKIIVSIFRILEKLTLKTSDAIITICPDLQKVVKSYNQSLKSYLIENVAENSIVFGESNSPSHNEDIKKKYKIPDRHKIFLYTGTFERYQGIDLLLRAAHISLSKHKNLVFILVGGKDEQIKLMKRLADEYKISNKVIFTGSVHPREIYSFYEMANVIVSPRKEGTNTPLKIYSYLRSGKPILATNCYTHTQVLDNNVALLIPPTPDSLAEGIEALLNNDELGIRLANNAKRLAERKYSYLEYLNKTEIVYQNLPQGS